MMKTSIDPLLGPIATMECALCGLGVFVDPKAPPTGPVTCLTCEENSGKAIVKNSNTIKALAH